MYRELEQNRRVRSRVVVVGADGVPKPHVEMAERSVQIVNRRDRALKQIDDSILHGAVRIHLEQHEPVARLVNVTFVEREAYWRREELELFRDL